MPGDHRLAVRAAPELALDDELPQPAEHDVEPAVGQLLHAYHLAHSAGREDGRPPVVVRLPALAQERHADQAGAARRIADHLPIARLEDVEREHDLREQDDVRQREDGDDVGQRHVGLVPHARHNP